MLSFQRNMETQPSGPAMFSVHSPMKIRHTSTTSNAIKL